MDPKMNILKDIELKHATMVAVLAKSGATIAEEMTGETAHLLHMAVGISGEVAKLVVAKGRENPTEELGDVEFYLEGLREGLHISRKFVLKALADMHPSLLPAVTEITSIVFEAGELLDAIKKIVIYRQTVHMARIVNTLARIEHILDFYRKSNDVTWLETLQHNYDKLEERYKGHIYSDKAAQERADKKEDKDKVLTEEECSLKYLVNSRIGERIETPKPKVTVLIDTMGEPWIVNSVGELVRTRLD